MTIDTRLFRNALGRFASGVCVVTTTNEDVGPMGVTISSFCSLSLIPPMILFCLGRDSNSIAAFLATERFAVNVLSEEQRSLSDNFASLRPNKFADVAYQHSSLGNIILDGCLVTIECRRSGVHEGGDHLIIPGVVENIVLGRDKPPLLWFRGAYGRMM